MSALSLYILTFNCGREVVDSNVFGQHLFDVLSSTHELPELLVLSLQEISTIAYSFLGGSYLTPVFNAFRQAVKIAGGGKYTHVVTRNVGMTACMVFALDSSYTTQMKTAGVGLGLYEMGNKGAVGVRLTYKEVEMTFVTAHLAPMEDAVERRNEDWKSIVKGLVFTSEGEDGETQPLLEDRMTEQGQGIYSPTSHLFVAGDLNYRVSDKKPTPDDIKRFPQPVKDKDDPSHFSQLLKLDQLSRELKRSNTLHGFTEAKITFPPTYKYSHSGPTKDDVKWNWATHRWPSWCDRILYLDTTTADMQSSKIEVHGYYCLPLFESSDHRPVALSFSIPAAPVVIDESAAGDVREQPPFSINPLWKSYRADARRKEIVVGVLAYLSMTMEGRALTVATVLVGLGVYLILRSLLSG